MKGLNVVITVIVHHILYFQCGVRADTTSLRMLVLGLLVHVKKTTAYPG